MKTVFIDGNNLIGKIPALLKKMKCNPQSSREELVRLLERYQRTRKEKVCVFFDGYARDAIASDKIRILYSDKRTADECLKESIENAKNRKLITVVSSDHSVAGFARKCSCHVMSAEDYVLDLQKNSKDEEAERLSKLANSNNEFLQLFLNKSKE